MDTPPTPFESLAGLAKATDPAERAKQVGKALDAVPKLQKWLRTVRQEAVQEMRASGLSHADVAKELGVSRVRAHQIAEGLTTGKRAQRSEPTEAE
jgi:DNA-binding NarL/FixJ family response regulator